MVDDPSHWELGVLITYRIRYQTKELGEIDLHLRTLRDKQQFSDDDHTASDLGISSALWPIFGVLWDSGEILAHYMATFSMEGKRILEVGCGIGMASLVLNHRHADITATDYHPEAGGFLAENVKLNKGKAIPFFLMDWTSVETHMGKFDLIIGSDLLYERGHAKLLSTFVDHHANKHCEVIIVDPGRNYQNNFSKEMLGFLFVHTQEKPENTDFLLKPFNGWIHRYLR